jgi:signal transduction histidine kinase/CheY-like chemotaxis protein
MTVSLSDGHLEKMFLDEQTILQCSLASKIPIGVVLISVLLLGGAWSSLHPFLPVLWFAIVLALLGWRILVVWRFKMGYCDSSRMYQWLSAFSIMNGVTMGLGVFCFMSWYTQQWQAIASMMVVGIVAGAVPATALRKYLFTLYTIPVIAAITCGWAVFGKADSVLANLLIASLFPLYLWIFIAFVSASEAKAKEGFKMRYENLRLVEELRLQQQETIKERDMAQKANLAKARFLASASHDLRQPLQTIAMYNAALSLRKLDQDSQLLLKNSMSATASLTSLLNALLDVSQLDTNMIKPMFRSVDLSSKLMRLTEEFTQLASHNGKRFINKVPEGMYIFADPILIERIVRNLVDNAFKHGARTQVVVSAIRVKEAHIQLDIFDDGFGVPLSEQEAIFEEFYQLKNPARDRAQGLGLGLAIVRRVAALMDVRCTLKSDANGTTFSLVMLRSTNPSESSLLTTPEPTSDILDGKRILILDDDADVRDSLEALLNEWGCITDKAESTTQALELIQHHSYLALLVDFRLGQSQNGLEFLDQNSEILNSTATIMITGDASSDPRLIELKATLPIMRKPIDPVELKRTLVDIVEL